MISEQECMNILNGGDVRFKIEEVRSIRDLLMSLATIEYEQFKENLN
jgi:hypothetical protein